MQMMMVVVVVVEAVRDADVDHTMGRVSTGHIEARERERER